MVVVRTECVQLPFFSCPEGSDAAAASVQHVAIDHGGARVFVAKELVDRAVVVAVFQEMGCEGVAQCVTTRWLADSRREHRSTDGALQDCLVEEVTAALARLPV